MRGFDIRSIGPRDPVSGLVLGGNKTLLFNAEYVVNVGGPVRVLAFYETRPQTGDATQGFWLKSNAFSRLFALASRSPSGCRFQRHSIKRRIEVVSYTVLSTNPFFA